MLFSDLLSLATVHIFTVQKLLSDKKQGELKKGESLSAHSRYCFPGDRFEAPLMSGTWSEKDKHAAQ